MSNLVGSRCYCDRPVVMKTIWGGRNAGRRMEACVAGDCYYEVWIDEPLNTRARGALEELMQKNKDLHESYHKKMERVRARQVKRRGAIWAQLLYFLSTPVVYFGGPLLVVFSVCVRL